jgi:uncharacterized LabA/DUF88 family protein
MSDRALPMAQTDTTDRVILLIDGESLFQAAANLGFEIDYAKLLDYLPQQRKLIHAYFYTGISTGNQRQQSFLKWMQRNGYRVITKELNQQKDGRRSAELAVEIATDLLRLVEQVDCFIIITHNPNLTYAIQNTANQGVRYELIGQLDKMSAELINACDRVIDIASIREFICKAETDKSTDR